MKSLLVHKLETSTLLNWEINGHLEEMKKEIENLVLEKGVYKKRDIAFLVMRKNGVPR